jgi:DNA-binding MarR family transcriptional regulator
MNENESPYCHCLYYSSNALARIMTRMAEESFTPAGLTPSYAFVVMSVNKNPGILSGELARLMMLTPSTVTRLLEKLEKQDLVKRVQEGRNMLVFPTRQSVALNDLILKGWQDLYARIVGALEKEASAKLTAGIFQAAMKLSEK